MKGKHLSWQHRWFYGLSIAAGIVVGTGCVEDDGENLSEANQSEARSNPPSPIDAGMNRASNNPSGDCMADGDGAHPGYSVPGPNDVYLPDCKLALKRSLWRVFVQESGQSYVIPRPDGLGLKMGFCGDDEPLRDLFEANGLCSEFGDPNILNAMAPKDALSITSALHSRLRFEAVLAGDSAHVDPLRRQPMCRRFVKRLMRLKKQNLCRCASGLSRDWVGVMCPQSPSLHA